MSTQTAIVNTDADGFTRVVAKSKRGRSSRAQRLPATQTHADHSKNEPSTKHKDTDTKPQTTVLPGKKRSSKRQPQAPKSIVETQVEDVLEKQGSLKSGKFHTELQACLDVIQEFKPEEIVCYGIGSLTTQVSQWQLALVLLINQYLNVDICAFDPVVIASDCETLGRFGVSIIAENEEAKRTVTKRTLFFMPHCEEFLYNNVLAANWSPEQLSRILVIGNHLGRYKDTQSSEEFATKSPYIRRALPAITCTDLPSEKLLGLRNNPFAFTDTCVQRFGSFSTIDFLNE
ncbi:hypothetical protein GGI09_006207 [Coemansia sp. S100]|nr:hypothetical protein H4S03_004704 [Coemansia sp. S3946]KAJ2089892.1 hypothetical protein GGI09_006207 [Coemansia sp. S100]KAJ2095618.1 hypothetical protein GGI16_005146 [Coemansia sp. S142-1]